MTLNNGYMTYMWTKQQQKITSMFFMMMMCWSKHFHIYHLPLGLPQLIQKYVKQQSLCLQNIYVININKQIIATKKLECGIMAIRR